MLCLAAGVDDQLLHVRRLHAFIHRTIDPVNDARRRAGRRDEAKESIGLGLGHASLCQGRDVGQERRARPVGDGKRAQLSVAG
jgi:hypothetical protein